jgi:hypothetical protein
MGAKHYILLKEDMASTVEDTKLKALTYQDRDDIAPWLENLLYDRGPAEGISKSTIKPRTKPRQQFYKGNWMPSQKSAMIAEGIKHVLRDAGVPDSKVAVVATRIQNVFRDIASTAVSTQRMYEISRQVFKVEFAKAFGVVGSPFGMSESVETNVSSDHMEDRDEDKQKTYRNGKKMKIETYREKGYRDGPRKAQNLKQQYGMDWAYKPTSETSMNGNRLPELVLRKKMLVLISRIGKLTWRIRDSRIARNSAGNWELIERGSPMED